MIGSLLDLLAAEEGTAEAPAAALPNFRGIDFLAGGVWVSEVPPEGPRFASEMVYFSLAGQFLISDQASIQSKPLSSSHILGVMGADPARSGWLVMSGFSSTGSTLQLECAPVLSQPETSWTFEGPLCTAGKRTMVRQQIDKLDANRLKTSTHNQNLGGSWQLVGTQVYKRP